MHVFERVFAGVLLLPDVAAVVVEQLLRTRKKSKKNWKRKKVPFQLEYQLLWNTKL